MTKQGLDAASFLLLAEGHLRKARERLGGTEQSITAYMVGEAINRAIGSIKHAIGSIKHALELLAQEKEEEAQ